MTRTSFELTRGGVGGGVGVGVGGGLGFTVLTGIEVSRFPAKPAPPHNTQKLAKMVKMNLQLGRAESGRRRYRLIDKKSPPTRISSSTACAIFCRSD